MLRTGFSFTLHAEVPDRLLRLDERAADVVITDQAHAHGHPRLFGKSHRRADAGVGNRHDHVGIDRLLTGEDPAEVGPHLVDALAEHVAVRPREIHVLEDAVRERRRRERIDRSQRRRR